MIWRSNTNQAAVGIGPKRLQRNWDHLELLSTTYYTRSDRNRRLISIVSNKANKTERQYRKSEMKCWPRSQWDDLDYRKKIAALLHQASPAAAYITGTQITVVGGGREYFR
jgi:hypothetical protein